LSVISAQTLGACREENRYPLFRIMMQRPTSVSPDPVLLRNILIADRIPLARDTLPRRFQEPKVGADPALRPLQPVRVCGGAGERECA
jgi:hypothetical protein